MKADQLHALMAKVSERKIEVDPLATNEVHDHKEVNSDHCWVERSIQYFNGKSIQSRIGIWNPALGELWPGNVLSGASLPTGNPAHLFEARPPGTITLSNLAPSADTRAGSLSRAVDVPTLASVTAAIQSILSENRVAERIEATSIETGEAFDSNEFAFKLGMQASALGANIDARIAQNRAAGKLSRYARLEQHFYTATFVPRDGTTAFCASSDLTLLRNDVSHYGAPVYISGIDYGRIVIMLFDQSATITNAQASGGASGDVVGFSGEVKTETLDKSLNGEARGFVVAVGGMPRLVEAPDGTVKLADVISALSKKGEDPQGRMIGAPIAYNANDVLTGQPVAMQLVARYTREQLGSKLQCPPTCNRLANDSGHTSDWLRHTEARHCTYPAEEPTNHSQLVVNFANTGTHGDCKFVVTPTEPEWDTGYMKPGEMHVYTNSLAGFAGKTVKFQIWSPGILFPGSGGGQVTYSNFPSAGDVTINLECGQS
jgi:hypothetical protein